MNNVETPEYRKYKLVARLIQGSYKGRVYDPNGEQLGDFDGKTHEELISTLRIFVDELINEKANSRTLAPVASEYVQAFQNIINDIPDSYLAMLKAHYIAPDQTMTATQLAEAGNYKNWSSANLHYGLLGKRIYEEMPMKLEARADGTLIYTGALATEGMASQNEKEWLWKLRPEVSDAIKHLGLQN